MFNDFEKKQKHTLASPNVPLKKLKPSITSEINVSNSTDSAAADDNQPEMIDLKSALKANQFQKPSLLTTPFYKSVILYRDYWDNASIAVALAT